MRLGIRRGSLSATLGLCGVGMNYLVPPPAKLVGVLFIVAGLLVFLFDVEIHDGHIKVVTLQNGLKAALIGFVVIVLAGVSCWYLWPLGSSQIITTDHPSQYEATIPLLPPANLMAPPRKPLPLTTGESPSERVIVSETPSYLLRMYSNHTSLEADKLTAPYIGKWMRLSGVLRDVQSPTPAGIAVKFISIEKYQAFIDTWFDDKWLDKLSVLRAGTKIVALCQIQEIQPKSMTFQHCEIDVAH